MQASAAAPIAEKFVLLAPPLNYAWQTRAAAAAAGAPAPLIEAALQVLRVRCPQFDEIDSEKLAAQLKGQALIIGAERDRVVDPDNARKIALRWPGARSFMASQASHRSILTDPATQAAALEFIAL
jgi:pimeloyl-ACP methyl ester carboxylesterase